MIIVNLKGGLGNQMFQYALGRNLAIKNDTTLKLDISSLSQAKEIGNIYRPFALDSFNIKNELATTTEIKTLGYPYGVFSKYIKLIKQKIFRQFNVVFAKKILDLKDNQYLEGFWQSPKYFESIREVLLNDFTLSQELSFTALAVQAQIISTTSVSVHIRRGDYVENKSVKNEFGICSISYYQKAIEHIYASVTNPTFFVFSDDIPWVKENIPLPVSAIYIQDPNISTVEELVLMSQCQHNIIANSSFSWWAAWLNQNPEKIVIAPTPWFDTIAYDKDLIPASWIQLPK
jgi:Glycosyl transferase family 11